MRRLFGPSCALLTLPYKGKGKRKKNNKLFYPTNKLPLPLYRKRFIRGCGSQAVTASLRGDLGLWGFLQLTLDLVPDSGVRSLPLSSRNFLSTWFNTVRKVTATPLFIRLHTLKKKHFHIRLLLPATIFFFFRIEKYLHSANDLNFHLTGLRRIIHLKHRRLIYAAKQHVQRKASL